jgi:protein-disulfide isomerase
MSEAAAGLGRFWDMYDLLYDHQHALSDADLLGYVAAVGLDRHSAWDALQRHVHASTVRAHFESGVMSGVNSTPTLFINEVRYDGSQGLNELLLTVQYAARRARWRTAFPQELTRSSCRGDILAGSNPASIV